MYLQPELRVIDIRGQTDGDERLAAERIAEIVRQGHPPIAAHSGNQLWIVAGAQCYGSTHQDVDVLLLGSFLKSPPVAAAHDGQAGEVDSFVIALEVKHHSGTHVRFEGARVWVRYPAAWKDASKQSEEHVHSVRKYLERRGVQPPFVINLVWLRNVPSADLPAPPHNILGSDAAFADVLARLWDSRMAPRTIGSRATVFVAGQPAQLKEAAEAFIKGLEPTRLDRRRMEWITKRWLDDEQHAADVGDRLLLLRGSGGTGKTVALLRIANDFLKDRGERSLVLTYNNALVADVRRLLALLKMRTGGEKGDISIQTVHSFVLELARVVLKLGDRQIAIEEYEGLKEQLSELLPAMTDADRDGLRESCEGRFDWDHILIDEAQDWPDDERRILFEVYGHRRFIVADGIGQLVRGTRRLDWFRGIDAKERQTITLKKVRRLKANLCVFLQKLARQLDAAEPEVVPDWEAAGGRVVIVEGDYLHDSALHDEVMRDLARDGNEPVDLLFCVTDEHVHGATDADRRSIVADAVEGWGGRVWDGTNPFDRRSFPVSVNQQRIVQYDSCRGLEGWTVICLGFDVIYERKLKQFLEQYEVTEAFETPESMAREYAAQWLLMAVARAIDTLVIEVAPGSGCIRDALAAVAQECGESVQWIKY